MNILGGICIVLVGLWLLGKLASWFFDFNN